MRLQDPIQKVEKKQRADIRSLLLGLGIFTMLVALLLGNVRLYEKKEQNRLLKEQLEERQEELQALKQAAEVQPDLRSQAEALGLAEIDPAAVKILHVRGSEQQ